MFLRSAERTSALKRDNYTCQKCGKKKSQKKGFEIKIECHHKKGVLNWEELIDNIKKYLLCEPEFLETLCRECHEEETAKQ